MAQQVLNLNNEVVKMRKEVKKVRVLTVRKLTRHIAKLKAKKGSEDAVLKNHRRAQRLLQEIHAMKEIKFDQVTKSALERKIDFGIICKKPNSTARDRAIARLASHPLLKTKIANIKAAVEAFKNSRCKPASDISSKEHELEEQLIKHPEDTKCSNSNELCKALKHSKCQGEIKGNEKLKCDTGEKHIFESGNQKVIDNVKKCPLYTSPIPDAKHPKLIHQDQIENTENSEGKVYLNDIVSQTVSDAGRDVSDSERNGNEDYFDDSTEERFYNQSSGTDESDNNDDFFIGKVKQMKKKRTTNTSDPAKEKNRGILLKKTKDPPYGLETNRKESSENTKAGKPESVFYYLLSNSQKSGHEKRDIRGHLPRNKGGKSAFAKLCPQKQMPKSSAKQQHTVQRKHSEQPLHPSWEASRKQREQISQITAFQGKKIKFED